MHADSLRAFKKSRQFLTFILDTEMISDEEIKKLIKLPQNQFIKMTSLLREFLANYYFPEHHQSSFEQDYILWDSELEHFRKKDLINENEFDDLNFIFFEEIQQLHNSDSGKQEQFKKMFGKIKINC